MKTERSINRLRRLRGAGYVLVALTMCFIVVWVLTLFRWDELRIGRGHRIILGSNMGTLELEWERRYELREDRDDSDGESFHSDTTGKLLEANEWELEHWANTGWYGHNWRQRLGRLGFQHFDGINGNFLGPTDWTISYGVLLPYWMIVTSTLVSGAACFFFARRKPRRTGESRCANCGYDLRATPERCPECGNLPEQAIRT